MIEITKENIIARLENPIFRLVGQVADSLHRECYVVGGFVRDLILERPSKDIDFVTVGSGIEVAEAVAARLGKGAHLSVFRNFGTANVKKKDIELEFVGARRESYNRGSRNPIVEDGTLDDDQKRRDFTINAMAICVNADRFGELLDPFNGINDLKAKIIRTPLNPDTTFRDDPLRMMRAVRFATQLEFEIQDKTFESIERNKERIAIISQERVCDELGKIIRSSRPSRGFTMLNICGLLALICPELSKLNGVETREGRAHKDNFLHTMQVLDNVARKSDNEWLRWATLFHDIGKPATKRYDSHTGWTFHNHNFVGAKMVPRIFKNLRLPLDDRMKYVQKLVSLHMRPIALVEDIVTDSAVRRLLFEAGNDIDDLMILCEADITSKNEEKVKRFLENYVLVRQKLIDIEEKDRLREFQPPIPGELIMSTFGLQPSKPVGQIKDASKEAIIEGDIENDYNQAYQYMLTFAQALGYLPVNNRPEEKPLMHWHTLRKNPLGCPISVAAFNGKIVAVRFNDDLTSLATSLSATPKWEYTPLIEHCETQISEYLNGDRKDFDFPTELVGGTDLQRRVWNALRQIPYGKTISYKELAKMVGSNAVRAVATAVGKNPLPIVIPCHRVIHADGSLGHFTGGDHLKPILLSTEQNH
mgnify:FL=1